MGTVIFHTIVVTADHHDIEPIHQRAREIFERRGEPIEPQQAPLVSAITPSLYNGWASFFIAPDGSKEGWEPSIAVDEMRDKFIEYLIRLRVTDEVWVHWVEALFGCDADEAKVERKSHTAKILTHSNAVDSETYREDPEEK
jgi:hypothetical protein